MKPTKEQLFDNAKTAFAKPYKNLDQMKEIGSKMRKMAKNGGFGALWGKVTAKSNMCFVLKHNL